MIPFRSTLVIRWPRYSHMYQLPCLSKATPNGSSNRAPLAGPPIKPAPPPATHSILAASLAAGTEARLGNRMKRAASSRLTHLLIIAILSPELDHDIRSLFVQVRINLPVAIVIHNFDQIHEVPLRNDMLAGNNSLVQICLTGRKHIQRPIVLVLVDAS